jgi:hypothetical protein
MMKKMIILLLLSLYINSIEEFNQLKDEIDSLCQNPEHKHFEKITLAYITPW